MHRRQLGAQYTMVARTQAVRKLDAEIARLKSEVAVVEQTAALDSEEVRASHEQQVAAMKLAKDLLQQQLAKMADSVPAMLRLANLQQDC